MPFSPVSLPIQEILMTHFVVDIATITNANILTLQGNIEDLINTLEIDVNNNSIGTTNPINFLKAQTVILDDTGLIYQTGSPTPVTIASLAKNGSNESVLTVDHIITNLTADFDIIDVNTLIVNTSATFDGDSTFNAPITITSSVIESSEGIQEDLLWDGVAPEAILTITLSDTSRQNIFLTLEASTSPAPNPVYDGVSIDAGISEFNIVIDFDATNPPAPNTKFTIYLVDIVNSLSASIDTAVQTAAIPIKFIGGTNQNISASIVTHNNNNSIGLSDSTSFEPYGTNVTFNYILDSNNDDRLLATSLVGASLF
jgi:hypothetical protein